MNTFLRCIGALCAVAALLLSLYMAGLVVHEAIVRYELQSDSASPFIDSLCQKIPGCLELTVEPRYDWMKAKMVITYHVRISADGAKRDEIETTLNEVAAAQTGLLGWALHSSHSTLDIATTPVVRRSK
jgi:hypothetical protein